MTSGDYEKTLRRAVSLLKRREHSSAELTAKLSKNCAPENIAAAVSELQKRGLLSDERFTRSWLREKGAHFGAARIISELSRLGINEELARTTMQEELQESEQERAIKLTHQKHPPPQADAKTLLSLARWLTTRGFNADAIRASLRSKGGAQMAEEWAD